MDVKSADELGLLRAVVTDPDEDTPRLVYADWLDEHQEIPCPHCGGGRPGTWVYGLDRRGGCFTCGRRGAEGSGLINDGSRRARAEFVRVQVELAGINPDIHTPTDRPGGVGCATCERYAELRRREGELLAAHGAAWDAALHDEIDWPHHHYQMNLERRRGFVEAVTCTAEDWLTHHATLCWHPDQRVPCPRCDGAGEAIGSDRPFEWRGPGSWPGPCPVCGRKKDVPRPFVPTAQPVRKVVLTTNPNVNPGHEVHGVLDDTAKFHWTDGRWGWVEFGIRGLVV